MQVEAVGQAVLHAQQVTTLRQLAQHHVPRLPPDTTHPPPAPAPPPNAPPATAQMEILGKPPVQSVPVESTLRQLALPLAPRALLERTRVELVILDVPAPPPATLPTARAVPALLRLALLDTTLPPVELLHALPVLAVATRLPPHHRPVLPAPQASMRVAPETQVVRMSLPATPQTARLVLALPPPACLVTSPRPLVLLPVQRVLAEASALHLVRLPAPVALQESTPVEPATPSAVKSTLASPPTVQLAPAQPPPALPEPSHRLLDHQPAKVVPAAPTPRHQDRPLASRVPLVRSPPQLVQLLVLPFPLVTQRMAQLALAPRQSVPSVSSPPPVELLPALNALSTTIRANLDSPLVIRAPQTT